MSRIDDQLLRRLRNEVSLRQLLAELDWPHRSRGTQLTFVCPRCGESRSDLNPRENLLRCFHCETNFNPIDFLIAARRLEFVDAVRYLQGLLPRA
jgi:hypothetical protein